MKGLYKNAFVDIIEKSEDHFRIQTAYGVIKIKPDELLEIPDSIYSQYSDELLQNDDFQAQIRAKQEEIKQRYYNKKDELDKESAKAWGRKQTIIQEIKIKVLC